MLNAGEMGRNKDLIEIEFFFYMFFTKIMGHIPSSFCGMTR